MTLVKRYQNRKLYNTESHTYIVLSDVLKLDDVKVICNKSKRDITTKTLFQALTETFTDKERLQIIKEFLK